jgi:hypothetical protein
MPADRIEVMSDLRVIADPTVYLLSKQTLQQGELNKSVEGLAGNIRRLSLAPARKGTQSD